jgi:hypothetical protein
MSGFSNSFSKKMSITLSDKVIEKGLADQEKDIDDDGWVSASSTGKNKKISTTTITTPRPFFDKWSLYFHLSNDPEWNARSYKTLIQSINNPLQLLQLKIHITENIVQKSMLFIMRDGIAPMWEDPMNKNGGCFSFKIASSVVHSVWWDFIFLLCGETLMKDVSKKNLVNGLTISPKYEHSIIKIWLKDLSFQDYTQMNLGVIRDLDAQKPLFKKHGSDK